MKKSSQRKKYLIILLVVVLVVGGVLWFVMNNKSDSVVDKMTGKSEQSGNAISSIKDALSKSVSLTCDFTDEDGNHVQTNIKNGAVRADITSDDPKKSGSTIIRDKKMYFWNAETAMMIDMPDVKDTPETQNAPQANTEKSGNADILKEMEKYKSSCKPAVVADSLFTPPADREFVDYSKMMPPAAQNGSEVNPEEYQKMMKQYEQQ